MSGPGGDRFGPGTAHDVHTGLAMLYLLLLPLATAPKDFAWGLLAFWSLLRAPYMWRCTAPLRRDPMAWLLVAWTAWHAVSVTWSADRAGGLDELGAFRVILTPLFLWPVLDRTPWLIGAFLVGVLGLNLIQLGQALEWVGLRPNVNDRLDGFLHAIHAAALCAAAICWHLSALLHGRRRPALSAASAVGLAAAAVGLVFTGSRGPWIAAAIAVPLGLVVIAARRPDTRRRAAAVALAGIVCGVTAWPLGGDFVMHRVEQAVADVRAAFGDEGDFTTDVGSRLARWSAAARVAADRPWTGAGAGGYGPAIQEMGYGNVSGVGHHAHSLYLHEAAVGGIVSMLLVSGVVVLAVQRVWRAPPDHPYADGTLAVLVSWLVGAQFDCYQLSGTMFGLFTVVVALSTNRGSGAAAQRRREGRAASRPGCLVPPSG